MPDDWEKAHQLDSAKANANGKSLSTAYDNIEVYMNSLVKDIVEAQGKIVLLSMLKGVRVFVRLKQAHAACATPANA